MNNILCTYLCKPQRESIKVIYYRQCFCKVRKEDRNSFNLCETTKGNIIFLFTFCKRYMNDRYGFNLTGCNYVT